MEWDCLEWHGRGLDGTGRTDEKEGRGKKTQFGRGEFRQNASTISTVPKLPDISPNDGHLNHHSIIQQQQEEHASSTMPTPPPPAPSSFLPQTAQNGGHGMAGKNNGKTCGDKNLELLELKIKSVETQNSSSVPAATTVNGKRHHRPNGLNRYNHHPWNHYHDEHDAIFVIDA